MQIVQVNPFLFPLPLLLLTIAFAFLAHHGNCTTFDVILNGTAAHQLWLDSWDFMKKLAKSAHNRTALCAFLGANAEEFEKLTNPKSAGHAIMASSLGAIKAELEKMAPFYKQKEPKTQQHHPSCDYNMLVLRALLELLHGHIDAIEKVVMESHVQNFNDDGVVCARLGQSPGGRCSARELCARQRQLIATCVEDVQKALRSPPEAMQPSASVHNNIEAVMRFEAQHIKGKFHVRLGKVPTDADTNMSFKVVNNKLPIDILIREKNDNSHIILPNKRYINTIYFPVTVEVLNTDPENIACQSFEFTDLTGSVVQIMNWTEQEEKQRKKFLKWQDNEGASWWDYRLDLVYKEDAATSVWALFYVWNWIHADNIEITMTGFNVNVGNMPKFSPGQNSIQSHLLSGGRPSSGSHKSSSTGGVERTSWMCIRSIENSLSYNLKMSSHNKEDLIVPPGEKLTVKRTFPEVIYLTVKSGNMIGFSDETDWVAKMTYINNRLQHNEVWWHDVSKKKTGNYDVRLYKDGDGRLWLSLTAGQMLGADEFELEYSLYGL